MFGRKKAGHTPLVARVRHLHDKEKTRLLAASLRRARDMILIAAPEKLGRKRKPSYQRAFQLRKMK
jgi:hypothetical protein